jgi:hypothetical protein
MPQSRRLAGFCYARQRSFPPPLAATAQLRKDTGMVPYRIVPADQSRVGARQLSTRRASVVEKTRSSDKSIAAGPRRRYGAGPKRCSGARIRSASPVGACDRCGRSAVPTGRIPWLIEMYEVRAMGLEVEAKLKIQNLKELEQLFRKTVWHP